MRHEEFFLGAQESLVIFRMVTSPSWINAQSITDTSRHISRESSMRLARFVVVVVVVVTDIKEALATVTINGMFLSFLFSSRNLVSLISSSNTRRYPSGPTSLSHSAEPAYTHKTVILQNIQMLEKQVYGVWVRLLEQRKPKKVINPNHDASVVSDMMTEKWYRMKVR